MGCVAILLAAASTSQAQLLPIIVPTQDLGVPTGIGVTGGSFESGIGNFTTTGEANVTGTIGGSGLLSPTQGTQQLFLETTGTVDSFLQNPYTATVSVDIVLDVFLGLNPGDIDAFVGVTDLDNQSEGATEGSAARQSIEVLTPTTLSFDYAFLTDELDQPSDFSDTAFFALDGELFLLGNVENAMLFTTLPGTTGFDGVIPYQSFAVNLDPGIHTFGFGVVDVSDTIVNSALLIDNVMVSPEPTSAAIFALMTGGLLLRRRA